MMEAVGMPPLQGFNGFRLLNCYNNSIPWGLSAFDIAKDIKIDEIIERALMIQNSEGVT